MARNATVGIAGGYGATGSSVLRELAKSWDGEILIGGRDLRRVEESAAKFDGRVSAAHLDVLDTQSLDDFCSRCRIVINCAGPVMLLQDRVAQAAFRNRCHYIDVADMSLVKERMLPKSREIADSGLSFVISAGWSPGLTELLPMYAYAQAKSEMDPIESLNVYFSDSGDWSDNALRDGAWYLRKTGIPKPGYFHRGEWVRARMSESSRKVDLDEPIGRRRFSLFSMPEQNDIGRHLTGCDVFFYSYLAGFQNVVAAMMLAMLPFSDRLGVRLLRGIFRRNRLPAGGFVVAHVTGQRTFTARIIFKADQAYMVNGLVPAIVARKILKSDGLQPGVHFLTGAVDPIAFMKELRAGGIDQTEFFE